MASPRRLTRNTLTLLTGNAGSAALAFLLSILIGRALGTEGIGAYGVVMAWVFPVRLLAEFGLGTLLTRDVAADVRAGTDLLDATLRLRLSLGGGLTVLLWLTAPLLSTDPAVVDGLRLSAPLIFIEPFFGACTAIFRAEQVMWPVAALNLGMLAIQVVLTALVLLGGGDVRAALAVNTLTSAGQLGAAWLLYRRFRRPRLGLTWDVWTLLRRAWPFALAAVLATLQARAGTILLDRLADTTQAGYYTAALRFTEAGRMIPNALFGALLPALAATAGRPVLLERTFRRSLGGLLLYGALLGGSFWLLAGPLLDLTYGPDFAPATPVLQIAMIGLLPALLRSLWTLDWIARGREGAANRVLAVILLAQLGLGLGLIPILGAVGAALAVLLAEALGLILLWRPVHAPVGEPVPGLEGEPR